MNITQSINSVSNDSQLSIQSNPLPTMVITADDKRIEYEIPINDYEFHVSVQLPLVYRKNTDNYKPIFIKRTKLTQHSRHMEETRLSDSEIINTYRNNRNKDYYNQFAQYVCMKRYEDDPTMEIEPYCLKNKTNYKSLSYKVLFLIILLLVVKFTFLS